jgi:hypothetical protein
MIPVSDPLAHTLCGPDISFPAGEVLQTVTVCDPY